MPDGPPDHWTKFSTHGLNSDEVLAGLDALAKEGFSSVAVAVDCTDGPYVFVGGYKS